MEKVLITDGLWRKSLAAVRALAKAGYWVSAGEKTPLATALFSRFANKVLVYPNPAAAPQKFLDFILAELKKEQYAAIFLMEEETLLLLDTAREEIEKLTRFPFASGDEIRRLRDKARLPEIASSLGISTPRTFEPRDLEELRADAALLPPPWVLKPAVSSGSRGRVYAADLQELETRFERLKTAYPRILLQERILGESFAASGLGDGKGKLLAFFAHQRLRTYPLDGGPATLAQSVKSPELERLTREFFSGVEWYGVGQLEFIRDQRQGSFQLLEFNPRFWGSLQLAVGSGVNFPELLLKMAKGESFEPVTDYQEGFLGGWFFPGEVLSFLSRPDKAQGLKELLSRPQNQDFIYSPEDWRPLAGKILSGINWLFYPELRRILKK